MWIDEYIMKLYDFRGIYRIFWNQHAIRLSKNRHDLILTVEFDFDLNLTVGSSYIC